MGSFTAAVLLAVFLTTASAIRTTVEEKNDKIIGMRLCQEQYGPFYYDTVMKVCCPCSSCVNSYGGTRNRIFECLEMDASAGYCNAPYFSTCMYLKLPGPPKTSSSTKAIANTTVPVDTLRGSTEQQPVTEASVKRSGIVSVEVIVVIIISLFCTTLICISACCLACGRIHASDFIKCVPGCVKNVSKSKDTISRGTSQRDCESLISENPPAPNGIHPSISVDTQHSSLVSEAGPREMMHTDEVRPASISSSSSLQRENSTDSSFTTPSSQYPSGRHILPCRVHAREVNGNPPSSLSTNITDCSNIGLLATPGAHVTIQNLNFHCPTSDPIRSGLNTGNQSSVLRVEGSHPARTFRSSTEMSGRRQELSLHRQSSEISSNSSGPVENEASTAISWNQSLAHQDQVRALNSCSQSQGESHYDSYSSGQGPNSHHSDSPYHAMNSGSSMYQSQNYSSGLPPQCDMEDPQENQDSQNDDDDFIKK